MKKSKRYTKETNEKISNTLRGHTFSSETRDKISKSLKKYFSENPGVVSKEKHPQWKDDSSSMPYDRAFNKELKEKIRKRDNYKCQKCWRIEAEHQRGRNLEVHHIDYNKQNSTESNLITLCRSCHAKTNFSRDDWQKHFEEFLRKPKIFISVLNQGWVRTELTFALTKWCKEDKYRIYLEMPSDRPIANNRNKIVKRFLSSDADYLIQIDSDNVPPTNPLKMIDIMEEKKIDVLSLPVWIYQGKVILNIYKYDERQEYLIPVDPNKEFGLIEVDATGTGLLVCTRKALEPLERPFARIFDNTYGIEKLGLDLAFSQKVKKAGFKIYSHLDHICKHYKTIDLGVFSQ